MPRRNLYVLLAVLVASFICYKRADSANRNHYASKTEAFVTAMSEIRDRYLYDVKEQDLFESAMAGMVKKLDPYSGYSGVVAAQEFRDILDQQFVGIGIEIDWNAETKSLRVRSPIIGTPAYDGGLMAGDEILAIDDNPTESLALNEAIRRIKGKPGEPVRLTIRRPGEAPRVLEIMRAEISVASVRGDWRRPDGSWEFTLEDDPKVGYIRVSQFGDKTTQELVEALQNCRAKGVRGLILDLRDNGGGLLLTAHEVCDLFIKEGVIVTIKGRNGQIREEYKATGEAQFTDWPMVVLVNGDSASASEIVAACLQDWDRAIIVGERTVGKGTVQATIDLGDQEGMLRLTIAGYWRPSDKNIHKHENALDTDEWGVMPSPGYEVKLTDKQLLAIVQRRRERDVIRRPGDHPIVPKPLASATPSATATGTVSSTGTVPGAKPQATVPEPAATTTSSAPSADPIKKIPPEEAAPGATTDEPHADGTDLQLEKALIYIREQISGKRTAA